MSVEVIVPWLPTCEHRQRAWDFIRPQYRWPVAEALGGLPWVKAQALAPAIEASSAEVIVVADADVWTEGTAEAVKQVQQGAAWAIPHSTVHRLDEGATEKVLAGARWQGQPVEQRPYHGLKGGGIVVASREVLLSVPMDPRFVGWGQEDESWGYALTCLVGEPWRGPDPLVHLWHPPQQRLTRRHGSQEGWSLRRRYVKARHDPVRMRLLIEEARAHTASQSPRDDRSPAVVR